MNKINNRSRVRPGWLDTFLIRERVARWRLKDRAKEWLRRLPRRVITSICFTYIFFATLFFSALLWDAYKHPDTALLTRPEPGPLPLLKTAGLDSLRLETDSLRQIEPKLQQTHH